MVSIMKLPNHIVVAASAWGGRIVTIIIQFYSIRLLLQLLGTDGYAAFTILVSLSGWLLLADIGIGNSLQNKISARRSEKNNYHDLILSAAILIVPIIFIISIIIYLLSPMLSGFLLSNFDFMSEPQKKSVFLLACLIYILTTLGTVSFKIWYAEKIGWLSNLIPVFSTTLGFVLLQIFTTMNHESQTYSLLFYAITTFYIPAAVIGIGTFCYQIVFSLYKGFLPSKTTALVLFNKGCGFFYFAIMAALIFQIDYIIMAKKITGEELVIYAIFSKIFGLTNFIYTSLLQAIWPMCAEANTKKEWDLYYQIGRKYIALGFGLVIFCSVGIWFFKEYIISILARNESLSISLSTILLFSFYHLIRVWTDTFNVFLMSMGHLKVFRISMPCQAVLSGTLQWIGASYYGINGLLYGIIASFILTVAWYLPFSFNRIMLKNKHAHEVICG